MSAPIRIAVLGSTGSVGRQTLEVIAAFPDRFQILGLCAGSNSQLLAEQVERFKPAVAGMASDQATQQLKQVLGPDCATRIVAPEGAISDIASLAEVDTVVAAVVGRAGLRGVWAAVEAGKRIALANKEALVMAGKLVMSRAHETGASLVPVDSEHASLAQLLSGERSEHVHRLALTASGGPFLDLEPAALAQVRAQDALAHPNWSMGAKISVDSATMMNKGFEVIEACWLFDRPAQSIRVLVHPESLVHALIELVDGSVLAHMGPADMRIPIAWALGLPERLDLGGRLEKFSYLDLVSAPSLSFQSGADERFLAIALCRRALEMGGGAEAALSVADEIVVAAFLDEEIKFTQICEILKRVLDDYRSRPVDDLAAVMAAGEEGRRLAREHIRALNSIS